MRNHLKELFILRLKNMQNRPKNFENRLENLKTHQKKEKKKRQNKCVYFSLQICIQKDWLFLQIIQFDTRSTKLNYNLNIYMFFFSTIDETWNRINIVL